jgi:DNA-binding transcriptional LysR family regulator
MKDKRASNWDHLAAMAVFARVVEEESFTAAAGELGLSKSAVSKQVGRLEDRLGVRLLNRTTRRISLTEAGAAFYERCRRMVAEAEAAEDAVMHLASAPRGLLRINAPMSFGLQHVVPALPLFLDSYPELHVDLVLNDRYVDLVEEGFDMGVRIGRLADSSLIARRLASSRRLVVAAPRYLERQGWPRTPRDLRDHDCLIYAYQAERAGQWRFRGDDLPVHVEVAGRLRANNGDALREAAVAGLGIALMPTFIAGDDLRAGRLVHLLPGWREEGEGDVYAVYPASRNLSPKVRVFVDFLAGRFGDPPYWDDGLFEEQLAG